MVASSGIILIRRGSFVRALRGRARPGVRPYRAHNNAEPGLSARDNTNDARVLLSAPGEGALARESALTRRTQRRARALSPGTPPPHASEFSPPRPERARSAGGA